MNEALSERDAWEARALKAEESMAGQADEIERLEGELADKNADADYFAEKAYNLEAQLADMRAALGAIVDQGLVDELDSAEDWSELMTNARQVLTTNAGKTAAEVLAAAEALRTISTPELLANLRDRLDAHRAATEKGDG